MKTYKIVSEEVNALDKVICDRCKKECNNDHPGYGDPNDGDNQEFHLIWNTVSDWYDGPRHSVDVDLCWECRAWLFKLLLKEGVEIRGLDGGI